jgi:hypothetical protein
MLMLLLPLTVRRATLLVGAPALVVLTACEVAPCDPGQVLRTNNICVVDTVDGGDGGAEDASSDAPGDAPTEGGEAGVSFGQSCLDAAGCGAPAPYCARQPGAPAGYCTATGCDTAPSLCPGGWRCNTDLGVFGVPPFCERP